MMQVASVYTFPVSGDMSYKLASLFSWVERIRLQRLEFSKKAFL